MPKPLVARLFTWGIAGLLAGLLLGGASMVIASWGNVYVYEGSNIVGVRTNGAGLVMAMLAGPAAAVGVGGALTGFVAWVGAMVNARRPPTRTWFVFLLVLGLPSLGLASTLPYLLLAPEASGPATAAPRKPGSSFTARS